MKRQFISVLLLLLLRSQVEAQRPYPDPNPNFLNCAVSGRVLDDSNRPVADAMLSLYNYNTFFRSDSEGRFLLEYTCRKKANREILFVTAPFTLDKISPVEPQGYNFNKLGSAFPGKKITLKRNEITEIGDIRVQVYYANIIIKFQNNAGTPLFGKDVNWWHVWLRVRDERGQIIQGTSISTDNIKEYVRTSESIISMYLPEGKWFIEINPNEDRGYWYKANRPVIVQRSDCRMEITLTMY